MSTLPIPGVISTKAPTAFFRNNINGPFQGHPSYEKILSISMQRDLEDQ
jgi:hypothetical protein